MIKDLKKFLEKSKMKIIDNIKYINITLKHKFFVFKAGLKIGTPLWRLITHDITKLGFYELGRYGNLFFGKVKNNHENSKGWLHHQNSNDHHWEYWIPRTGHDRCNPRIENNKPVGTCQHKPMKMDHEAVLEMVADWIGASRAYNGEWPKKNEWKWFNERFQDIIVHKETKKEIIEILKKLDLID